MIEKRQQAYSYDDILKISEGTLFGSEAPRLPYPNLLMFDRILRVSEQEGKYKKGQVTASLDIRSDLWFFQCHFKDDPVMPGCLGLDGMWQLMGFFLAWMGYEGRGRALGVKDVKFSGQIIPTNHVIRYIIDIKRVINLKLVMVIADGCLEVDNRIIYTASDMRVGLFSEKELLEQV